MASDRRETTRGTGRGYQRRRGQRGKGGARRTSGGKGMDGMGEREGKKEYKKGKRTAL